MYSPRNLTHIQGSQCDNLAETNSITMKTKQVSQVLKNDNL